MDVVVYRSELEGEVTPPPSKSYTHRAFFASSLSHHSFVTNPLISDDTISTLRCCCKIGSFFRRNRNSIEFFGCDEISGGYFYTANSGTTTRFLIGILSLSRYKSIVDGDSSVRRRPNYELVIALKKMGADIRGWGMYEVPVHIRGIVKGGEVEIECRSSQFISSLLFTLPLARYDSCLRVLNMRSKPYIEVTLDVLERSGIEVEWYGNEFYIRGEQEYGLKRFYVPSDFTSISYLIAAGILAGKVEIRNAFESKQGDRRIVDIVRDMGGDVRWYRERGVIVARKSELNGVEIDAKDIPDLVPTISILASVANGKTVIRNVESLRFKEIDRMDGIYRNLKSLGVEVKIGSNEIEISGREYIRGGTVESFGDHRMALAFSLLGLVSDRGVRVRNAEVVSISYPNYFDVLRYIGAKVKML